MTMVRSPRCGEGAVVVGWTVPRTAQGTAGPSQTGGAYGARRPPRYHSSYLAIGGSAAKTVAR